MILTCPACGTQYAVKDGAIPAGGRKVRCASCGHSWHQDPPHEEAGEAAPPPEEEAIDAGPPREEQATETEPVVPVTEPSPAPGDPAAPVQSHRDTDDAEAVGVEPTPPIPPGAELVEPPTAVPVPPPDDRWPGLRMDEQEWDPEKEIPDAEEIEAAESEDRSDRQRNWLMGILFAIALVAVIALAFWFFAPDSLRQQVGFAAAAPSPLQIAPATPERQKLASGNELVVVSGRVINPSSKDQPVPPIEAELRDGSGRLVYAWEIAPPARSLPPGGSAAFNSAEMGVPASGLNATVTLTLKG
jgi:predicted Zn finger-like uncharacterized protein